MEAVSINLHPHILLAEDDLELRELLMLVLSRAGYEVTDCDNGMQLLEQLEQAGQFDLVLTDLRMPALTGLEVLESQFDNPHLPPFICMTAFGDEKTHALARKLGANATIDKPFDLDELLELISAICLRGEQKNMFVRSQS